MLTASVATLLKRYFALQYEFYKFYYLGILWAKTCQKFKIYAIKYPKLKILKIDQSDNLWNYIQVLCAKFHVPACILYITKWCPNKCTTSYE